MAEPPPNLPPSPSPSTTTSAAVSNNSAPISAAKDISVAAISTATEKSAASISAVNDVSSSSNKSAAVAENAPSALESFITAAKFREGENSGGTTMTMTALAEETKSKRARRVSFAEMTSVHFFDRDEYETNSTNSEGSAKVEEKKVEREEEGEDCEKEESEYDDDDEEEEERGVGGGFFKVDVSSPGSNLSSATSNNGGELYTQFNSGKFIFVFFSRLFNPLVLMFVGSRDLDLSLGRELVVSIEFRKMI